ncbi:MAG: carboxypeptidase-like regulatory domain-containing protein, partial [Blastocatellia bacterium]
MSQCRRILLSLGIVLSTIMTMAFPLAAQVDRAAISGTVSDSSGALVPGAKVELVSPGTGLHRETVTDTDGIYHFPALPVGEYTLTISKEGFKSVDIPSVVLAVGQPRTIDVQLGVGTVSESIQVKASVETVNRSSAEVGGLVDSVQIRELPISGRNWASLMLLVPGAINYGDGAQRSIRFSGHSLDDSNFTFDGIDTSGVQEQTQKADTRLNIALDSIAEFRVSTGVYTAESGAAGGAQINVVSKTGT